LTRKHWPNGPTVRTTNIRKQDFVTKIKN